MWVILEAMASQPGVCEKSHVEMVLVVLLGPNVTETTGIGSEVVPWLQCSSEIEETSR